MRPLARHSGPGTLLTLASCLACLYVAGRQVPPLSFGKNRAHSVSRALLRLALRKFLSWSSAVAPHRFLYISFQCVHQASLCALKVPFTAGCGPPAASSITL